MEFKSTENQEMIAQTVRDFAEKNNSFQTITFYMYYIYIYSLLKGILPG